MSAPGFNFAAENAYPTPYRNSPLLPLLLLSLASQKSAPDISFSFKDEYDYIVIGAGSAGSVVAARLSEKPCVNILLLEAGPPAPKLTDIPTIGTTFWFSNIDWAYKTTPQKYTGYGLKNRQIIWPSGKALGGSSVINGGLHIRGNKNDYDDWAAMGAKGWSYEDVLPYFKKLEDNKDYFADGYHGIGGPVTVMKIGYEPEIKRPISIAAEAMGYKYVDSNGPRQIGFSDFQANLRNNQRCSTAKAYLVPAENRANLDILPNSMVEKIIIENNRATGVLFANRNQTYLVRAKREVILSAGAINSAQLLMLSGIGPKEELQKFNIPVYADLPVGQNLHDQCGTGVNFVLNPQIQPFLKKIANPENVLLYINSRRGPLASSEGCNTIAFLHGDEKEPRTDVPNYQINFFESASQVHASLYSVTDEVYKQVYAPYENQTIMACLSNILQPKSRGTVTLQSANPYDPPIIDPNYLADFRDVEDLVQGLKTCRRIGNSDCMKSVVSHEFQTLFPGCEMFADNEDRYFECQARTEIYTLSHQCSTAKMGDHNDPTTVVDPKLRVKNIEGLRVVDNSIMPKVTSGNTNVPAIMIGEKASDMIKETICCDCNDYYIPERGPFPPQFKDIQLDIGASETTAFSVGKSDEDWTDDSGSLAEPQYDGYQKNPLFLQPRLETIRTVGSAFDFFP